MSEHVRFLRLPVLALLSFAAIFLVADARASGTLNWGTSADADSLDPHAMAGWIGRFVTQQIYESLLDEDLTNPNATSVKLKPALATDFEVTEGGTVWSFTLRQGVKFQDGAPFDADAVKFNFDRLLDDKAPQFYPKAKAFAYGFASWIDKVETPEKYKVRVTLKKPNYEWFQTGLQSSGAFLIISPAAIKKYGNEQIGQHPTGTGKFKFVARQPGAKIILERNDDYWGEKPKIDRLVVWTLPDAQKRVDALLAHEVEVITSPPWDKLEDLKKAGFQLVTNENVPSMWYVSINMRHAILRNRLVRQALNFALNREDLVKQVLQGAGTPAWGMLTPGTPAFDPNFRAYEYDPEKAKRLLAEAGYPDGFDVTFQVPEYGAGELWEQRLQRDLKRIGVNVTMQKMDWMSYLREWMQGLKDDVGLCEMGWGESVPSWSARQAQSAFAPPMGTNVGWYTNKKVDDLFDKALAEADLNKRMNYYRDAQKIISDDAAFIPAYNDNQPVLISPKVKGFVNPAQNWFDISTISIDP